MRQTMFRADLFLGQRILITGGGTGLGYAMARQLAALGATVHLCGRRLAVLEQAAQALRARPAAVHVHPVDIRDAGAVDAMVARIWDQHGGLDALVNNAAGNFISPTENRPNGASMRSPTRSFVARST